MRGIHEDRPPEPLLIEVAQLLVVRIGPDLLLEFVKLDLGRRRGLLVPVQQILNRGQLFSWQRVTQQPLRMGARLQSFYPPPNAFSRVFIRWRIEAAPRHTAISPFIRRGKRRVAGLGELLVLLI